MDNPFQLTFTLKQHTPLIHFQHEQDGATLRITEVKPKLDRFIIQKCKEQKINYKNWVIGKGEPEALDYKLKIVRSKNEDSSQRLTFESTIDKQTNINKFKVNRNSSHSMILANMVAKDTKEELKDIRFFEELECSILCFKSDLTTEINKYLRLFFATNNFGNRNNKGFGGFTISKMNETEYDWDENLLPSETLYLSIESNNSKKIFDVIDFFYKWLKSGINYSYDSYSQRCTAGRYKKAVIFEYLESLYPRTTILGDNWEKKWIKEKYLKLPVQSPVKYNSKYYRALLGLSDKHTLTKAHCHNDIEFVSDFQSNMNSKIELRNLNANEDIDRIQSPITFKVVKIDESLTRVYILLNIAHINEIFAKDLCKEFTFFKESELKIEYEISGVSYKQYFKYPKDKISDLDEHLNRIQPHMHILDLKRKYEEIEKFRNQFNSIELPQTILNFQELLEFFQSNYPSFRAKNFRWEDIVDSDIHIQKIN